MQAPLTTFFVHPFSDVVLNVRLLVDLALMENGANLVGARLEHS